MSETTRTDEPTVDEAPPPSAPPTTRTEGAGAAPEATKAAPQPTPPRARVASRRATSDVAAGKALGLAIPFYLLAVLAASMAPKGARELLLERGWPPHATMVLTALALAILLVKTVGLRRQRRAFRLELLPEGSGRIAPEQAADLADHVAAMQGVGGGPRSFLVERVVRVLRQYAAHGDVAEAAAANDADADADAASVAASFSTVKVLVWAMPILGLIGTVVGLSGAVGSFSHAMSGADQLDTIKDSLRQVTTGLAVAFDATFVALVGSILVMLPMTWLQKAEDQLVNEVDDYCVTNLLSRLGAREAPAATRAEGASTGGVASDELRAMLHEAIAQPLGEMLTASARVLRQMAADRAAVTEAEQTLTAQIAAFGATLREAAPTLERAACQLDRSTHQVGPSVERMIAALEASAAAAGPSLERAVGQLEKTTAQVTHGVDRAVAQLEAATGVADRAASSAERAQDQLSRELGASRQLLALLAAGLGAGDAAHAKPRQTNGTNGTHGAANGTQAARGE